MSREKLVGIECDHCSRKAKYMEEYLSGNEEHYVTKYVCRKHRERRNVRRLK